jgi:hypothetical protein
VKKPAVASAAMAMKAVRDVRAAGESRGPLRMCGSTAPLEELRRALLDAPGTDAGAVDVFAARRLRADDAQPLSRAAVVIYGAQVVASLDDGTRADLEVVGRAGRPLVAVLEGVDLPDEALLEAARVPGVHPLSVLPAKRGRFPLRRAMRLLAERAGVRVRWVAGVLAALVGIRPFRGVWIVHRVRQRVVRRGVLRDVAGVLARGLGEAADRFARLRLARLRSLPGLGRRSALLGSLRLLGFLGRSRPGFRLRRRALARRCRPLRGGRPLPLGSAVSALGFGPAVAQRRARDAQRRVDRDANSGQADADDGG